MPLEIDTPYCESLISYLTRLAGAHVVRPNVLVKEIILPLTDISLDTAIFSFCCRYSRTLNSYMHYAQAFRNALEKLTLQQNLDNLTLLPWSGLFDPKGSGLLRDHVGICPECLDESNPGTAETYYPIIWYLRAVRLCSKHQCRLEETCSKCGRHQNFIATHAMLGYCTHCGAWLGKSNGTARAPLANPEITDREKFMTSAVEQMVAFNSQASQFATHANLLRRIRLYSDAMSDGNIYGLEKQLGIGRGAVSSWFSKSTRPRFDKFLELCYRLGQMPIQFLSGEIPGNLRGANQQFHKHLPIRRVKPTPEVLRAMRGRLEAILAGDDLPSQPDIAEALGVKLRFLLYHFPDLTKAISGKRRNVISAQVAEKRRLKIRNAKAIAEKMFVELRPISRRKLWAAMQDEGLSFADRDVRNAALSVIAEHLPEK